MISFIKSSTDLLLKYRPDVWGDRAWVFRSLLSGESVKIRRVFSLERKDVSSSVPEITDATRMADLEGVDDFEHVTFRLGQLEGEYYRIPASILGTEFDLLLHHSIKIDQKTFIAKRDISIWPKLNKLKPPKEIYVGGEYEGGIPESVLKKLIQKFPNSTELDKYVSSRVSAILRDDLDLELDADDLYEKYMAKKASIVADRDFERIDEIELSKFALLQEKLTRMLDREDEYTESQWQHEILGLLRLLFPKYIHVFREGPVIDKIFGTTRSVDFLLVDFYGNIDIVEIKKPKGKSIVSTRRYRDNHIPLRELSGTVMQVEKYIYHLNRSAEKGEKKLLKRYQADLPIDFKIKITNPKGIIVMGRENDLDSDQLRDFEIIKRKYINVIDIVTYDDLLRRIKFSIEQLQKPAT